MVLIRYIQRHEDGNGSNPTTNEMKIFLNYLNLTLYCIFIWLYYIFEFLLLVETVCNLFFKLNNLYCIHFKLAILPILLISFWSLYHKTVGINIIWFFQKSVLYPAINLTSSPLYFVPAGIFIDAFR